MDVVEHRVGALYVCEQVRDTDWVQRALRRIDKRLSLERQVGYDGEAVWCVIEDVGLDHPAVTIYEHRSSDGRPLPYANDGILDEMRKREQRMGSRDPRERALSLIAEVDRRNAELVAARKREQREGHEEINREFRAMVGRTAVVPRSVGLRMTRDKMRARGVKC